MSATLAVAGLTKRFAEVPDVVHDVDMRVDAGDLTIVVGSHGSGRTTLLRCLAGTYRPDSGRVVLHRDAASIDVAIADPRALAWVRGHSMSVFDGALVAPPRRTTAMVLSRAAHCTIADAIDALVRLQLAHVAEKPLGRLRPNVARAVALAAALAKPAPLLLLDDPGESADHEVVQAWIRERRAGGTAVVATGRPGAALEQDATGVAMMKNGALRWVTP
jgi:ABC-type Mn2+/Zn2+ transport system ATPase subunit